MSAQRFTARRDPAAALIPVASLAAVAGALVSQHVFDMQPCAWCVLQRLIFVAIAAVALPAALARGRGLRRTSLALTVLLALTGVAAALWQHLVAASSTSCGFSFADKFMANLGLDAALPEIFQARVSCADAAADLLGVPYALWSLALFALLGAVALWLLRRTRV